MIILLSAFCHNHHLIKHKWGDSHSHCSVSLIWYSHRIYSSGCFVTELKTLNEMKFKTNFLQHFAIAQRDSCRRIVAIFTMECWNSAIVFTFAASETGTFNWMKCNAIFRLVFHFIHWLHWLKRMASANRQRFFFAIVAKLISLYNPPIDAKQWWYTTKVAWLLTAKPLTWLKFERIFDATNKTHC